MSSGASLGSLEAKDMSLLELKRIFVETIEVVFMHQNIKEENFGVAKLLDFMDQIIPTACVYGTAYWIFYSTSNVPVPFCVCNRFNIVCQHQIDRKFNAWVTDVRVTDCPYFLPGLDGLMYPKNVHFVASVSPNFVDMLLEFCVSSKTLGQTTNYCIVHIISRFNVIYHDSSSDDRILVFDPSPVVHPYYGSLLQDVLITMYKFYYKKLIVELKHTAKFTLQRIHSYVYLVPSINYNIEVPCIFSPTYNPLTEIDYAMINDICKSLLGQSGTIHTTEVINNFMNMSATENKNRSTGYNN